MRNSLDQPVPDQNADGIPDSLQQFLGNAPDHILAAIDHYYGVDHPPELDTTNYAAPPQSIGQSIVQGFSGMENQPQAPPQGFGQGFLGGLQRGLGAAGTRAAIQRQKLEAQAERATALRDQRNAAATAEERARRNRRADLLAGVAINAAFREPKQGDTISANDVLLYPGVLSGADTGKAWQSPEIQKKVANVAPKKPSSGFNAFMEETDPKAIAQMVVEGRLDPRQIRPTSRGPGAAVLTILAKQGYNKTKADLEMAAMEALTRNVNSGQMANLQRAGSVVELAIGNLDRLSKEISAAIPRSQVQALNKFNLNAAAQGAYGPQVAKLAGEFMTGVGALRTEVPTVLNGGYAPSAESQSTTDQMLGPFQGEFNMAGALKGIHDNVGYKVASIKALGASVPGQEGGMTSFPWMQQPQPVYVQQPYAPPASAPGAVQTRTAPAPGGKFVRDASGRLVRAQ